MKKEYWTMFRYGDNDAICGKHSSLREAHRSARRCEFVGGAPHWIIRVELVSDVAPVDTKRVKR